MPPLFACPLEPLDRLASWQTNPELSGDPNPSRSAPALPNLSGWLLDRLHDPPARCTTLIQALPCPGSRPHLRADRRGEAYARLFSHREAEPPVLRDHPEKHCQPGKKPVRVRARSWTPSTSYQRPNWMTQLYGHDLLAAALSSKHELACAPAAWGSTPWFALDVGSPGPLPPPGSPGLPAVPEPTRRAAGAVRDFLRARGVEPLLLSSPSGGVHVVVALEGQIPTARARDLAAAVRALALGASPDVPCCAYPCREGTALRMPATDGSLLLGEDFEPTHARAARPRSPGSRRGPRRPPRPARRGGPPGRRLRRLPARRGALRAGLPGPDRPLGPAGR